jgi:hypothetical protein
VSILTSERAAWTRPSGHLAAGKPRGDLMVADLDAVNRVRA